MTSAKKSPRRKAINGLRKAYLNLALLHCMNELEADQKWIMNILMTCKRRIGRMLRQLEPKRRLPTVLDDTELGRSIKEAEADQRRWAKCKHDLKPAKHPEWCPKKKGDKYEVCPKCGMELWTPPEA